MIKWIVAFSISNLDNDIPIFLNYYLVDTKIISVQSTVEIFNISNYSILNIFSKLIMTHVEFISGLIYSGCRRGKLRFLGVLEGVINFLKTNETYLKLKFIFDLFDQLDSRYERLDTMRDVFKSGLHRLAFRLTMRDRVGASGRAI